MHCCHMNEHLKFVLFFLFKNVQTIRECTHIFQAQSAGIFKDEIIPIEIRGLLISEDDTIRHGVTAESLAKLKGVFPGWGNSSTTAGNASGVGDGAALCVLTSRKYAEMEGMDILGKWVGCSVVGTSAD